MAPLSRRRPFSGLSVGGAESVDVLDSWATASLARFECLRRRDAILKKFRVPIARHYPARASFKCSKTEGW